MYVIIGIKSIQTVMTIIANAVITAIMAITAILEITTNLIITATIYTNPTHPNKPILCNKPIQKFKQSTILTKLTISTKIAILYHTYMIAITVITCKPFANGFSPDIYAVKRLIKNSMCVFMIKREISHNGKMSFVRLSSSLKLNTRKQKSPFALVCSFLITFRTVCLNEVFQWCHSNQSSTFIS